MRFWVGAPGLTVHRGGAASLSTQFEDWVQGAVYAEQCGFDGYTAPEHHFEYNDWCPFPLQALSAAAAVTSKIRLVTGAMLYTLYDPMLAMEAAATADVLSGGRVTLGLGMGYRPLEFDGMGFAKKTRGVRLSEAMEIMRLGTGNDSFSYQGKHYQYDNAQVYPRPVQRPIDMWLCGGTTPVTARRAGRSGFSYWIANAPYDSCVDIVGAYREEGHKAGFTDDQLRLAAFRDFFIGETVREAEEMRDFYLHEYYDEHIQAYGYLIDDDGTPLFWPGKDHPVYQRFADSLYCGTVEMVIEEIQRYRDLGIEAICVPPGQMDIFAEHIIPNFT